MLLEPPAAGWTPTPDAPKDTSRQQPSWQSQQQGDARRQPAIGPRGSQQSAGFGDGARNNRGGDDGDDGNGLVRVVIEKHPDYGFGLTLLGPAEVSYSMYMHLMFGYSEHSL